MKSECDAFATTFVEGRMRWRRGKSSERERYKEGDRNRNWHCDTDNARDRDRDRGIESDRELTQTLKNRQPFTRLWSTTFLPLGWAHEPVGRVQFKIFLRGGCNDTFTSGDARQATPRQRRLLTMTRTTERLTYYIYYYYVIYVCGYYYAAADDDNEEGGLAVLYLSIYKNIA